LDPELWKVENYRTFLEYRRAEVNKALEQVIVKTLASFLNGRGGSLLIGVDDHAKVVGLDADYATLGKRPDRDGYQQFLVQLVAGALGKNICADLSISFTPIQANEICLVRVSPSASPVYLQDQGQSRLIVRLGTSQEITGRQAIEYVQSHWPKGK
jgi:predicted HTH transcriptional regulator